MSHLTLLKDTIGTAHRCRRDIHTKSVLQKAPRASVGVQPSGSRSPIDNTSIQTSLLV
jgi:hypothetical protein